MKNFKNTKLTNLAALGLLLSTVACGGGGGPATAKDIKDPSGLKSADGQVISKKAAADYKVALEQFTNHDRAGSWTPTSCKSVADLFLGASAEQKSAGGSQLPEALYNAGLSYQRCGDDVQAKEQFAASYQMDKDFHRPRAQLALYQYKESGNIDQAIKELDQIIQDAKFQNVEGLVALASLQMQRGGNSSGPGCSNDLACAQLNLQRSLALDDSFMPAFNQLALYYLEQARGGSGHDRGELVVAGKKKAKINKQRLDLAALVASQAQKKNPNYAPIHNTTGLILVELENYNMAVKAFGNARKINPKLFEAQMNYGAVNLSFRGFGEAADAYRKALELKPNTYEAHLGLALALRGAISDANYDKNVAEAQKHLDAAKALEPKRPEAFYNEAILAEEYRAKRATSDEAKIVEFKKAAKQYESFVSNAGGKEAFKDAVAVSKSRIQDIKDTLQFMEDGIQMAKQQAEDDKRMKAEEEARKKEEAQQKKDEEAQKKKDEAAKGGAATPAPKEGAAK